MDTSNLISKLIISSTYSKDELLSKIKIKVHLTCEEFANYQIESFFTEAIRLADKKKLKGNDHTKYAMAVVKNKLGPDCCKKLGWKYKGTYKSVKPERQVKEFTFEKGDKVLVDLRHDEYVQGFKLGKIIKQDPMFTVVEYYDETVQSLPSNYRKIIGIIKGNKKIKSIIKGRPKDIIKNLVDRIINQPDERVKINRSNKPKNYSRST